uniref:Uncharacterized protein n=1 Tax=Plectus sambesii TaxID=2011161 RepID=A0A914WQA5_9BILA
MRPGNRRIACAALSAPPMSVDRHAGQPGRAVDRRRFRRHTLATTVDRSQRVLKSPKGLLPCYQPHAIGFVVVHSRLFVLRPSPSPRASGVDWLAWTTVRRDTDRSSSQAISRGRAIPTIVPRPHGDGDADQSSSSSSMVAAAATACCDCPIGKVVVSSDRTAAGVKPGVEPDNQTAARSSGGRFSKAQSKTMTAAG